MVEVIGGGVVRGTETEVVGGLQDTNVSVSSFER